MEKTPTVQSLLIIAGILILTLGTFFAGGIVLSSAHAASTGKPSQQGTPGPANTVKGSVTVTSVAGNTIEATLYERVLAVAPQDAHAA